MARLMQLRHVQKCFFLNANISRQVHSCIQHNAKTLIATSILSKAVNRWLCKPSLKGFARQITSLSRQNYHEECEAAVNNQINLELYGSYVYLSMAHHFDRQDIALKGFHNYFKRQSLGELLHAEAFMKLQNQRGGRILLEDIKKPLKDDWGTGLEAMETALELEKTVNQSLLDLHKVGSDHSDTQLTEFIEENFLTEQVEEMKSISDYISILQKNGPGLGEYLFDVNTLQKLKDDNQ